MKSKNLNKSLTENPEQIRNLIIRDYKLKLYQKSMSKIKLRKLN